MAGQTPTPIKHQNQNLTEMKGRIKRLRVKNLLSLRDVTIDFGEKLTVLVGPNAGGKSNIIKTLEIIKKLIKEPFETRPSLLERDIDLSEISFGNDLKDVKISIDMEIDRLDIYLTGNVAEITPIPKMESINFISRMGFYSFIPQSMLSEVEMEEGPILSRDGSNLAGLLAYLKLTDYKLFHSIEEKLMNYVPEIEEIILYPKTTIREGKEKKVYRICIRERGFKESFTNISDGTLRLLGFVTALSLNHSLVAFEEPENCIHPHLLELLVDMMRKADCQVVITTHSPYLLDYVEPEEVVVVWREMGEGGLETKVRRPSEEELERVKALLRDGWTLGEVWCSGVIGGVPE